MTPTWRKWIRFDYLVIVAALVYPLLSFLEAGLQEALGQSIGAQLALIFILAILALGLNVVVGYTGLLHLGIAAFFGIGAYITGILVIQGYPFQTGFYFAVIASMVGAGVMGVMLGAPTLRLSGDYLALVTLGFGEVVRFSIRNLEEITAGTKSLGPIPPPWLPEPVVSALEAIGVPVDWGSDYRFFYYLCLGCLLLVIVVLKNLENSKLGRSWMAIREDELAATCMGINASRVKLSAFALGAALAGLAGSLYATKITTTAGPDAFDFNRSIIMLCCIILGGLGSLRGTLLGVILLIGFDNVLAPILDSLMQESGVNPDNNRFLAFSSWRLMIFGLAFILMMRFRPEGLLPSSRVAQELHENRLGTMDTGRKASKTTIFAKRKETLPPT
jgi:branched-chain amino acid transport system permease protein